LFVLLFVLLLVEIEEKKALQPFRPEESEQHENSSKNACQAYQDMD